MHIAPPKTQAEAWRRLAEHADRYGLGPKVVAEFSKRARVARAAKRNPATKAKAGCGIPGLSGWNTYAADYNGKSSYDLYVPAVSSRGGPGGRLQYSINPIKNSRGRHLGYSLTVFPGENSGHTTIAPDGSERSFVGHDPQYRSPQTAVSAAKKHYAQHCAAKANPSRVSRLRYLASPASGPTRANPGPRKLNLDTKSLKALLAFVKKYEKPTREQAVALVGNVPAPVRVAKSLAQYALHRGKATLLRGKSGAASHAQACEYIYKTLPADVRWRPEANPSRVSRMRYLNSK